MPINLFVIIAFQKERVWEQGKGLVDTGRTSYAERQPEKHAGLADAIKAAFSVLRLDIGHDYVWVLRVGETLPVCNVTRKGVHFGDAVVREQDLA